MSALLELRILAGLHAGAVVELPADGAPITLGADEGNAIILRDADFATATLLADGADWLLDFGDRRLALAAGDGVRLGVVALALATPGSPWNDEAVRWIATADAPSPAPGDVAGPADRDDATVASPTTAAAPTAAPPVTTSVAAMAPTHRPGRSRSVPAILGVAVLGVTLAIGMAIFAGDETPTTATASPAAPAAVDLKAVEAVLREAGYGESVRVVPRGDGRVTLRGVVADEEAQEALLKSVSRVTRRVTLEMLTQREFTQRVQAVAALLPPGVEARAAERGIVALRGEVGSAEDVALSVSTVKTEIAEANGVDATALTVAKPAPVTVAEPRPPAAPKLPRLIAVQGGANSYVMLASGERLLPGASINGYRLAAIDDDAIVVEDRGGRRYRIPR